MVLWLVVPLAIVIFAWSPQLLPLNTSPDANVAAGLQMATHQGLTFGTEVIWTYGPLGFVGQPWVWWFAGLGQIAMVYGTVLRFATALAIFASARRTFPILAAALIALVVSCLALASWLLEPILLLIIAIWAVLTELTRRQLLATTLALAAFTGIQVLNKVSVGLWLIALLAVLVVSLPRWRRQAAATASAGVALTIVALWLLLGQDLSALPQYAVNSVRIASGFAEAMSLSGPSLKYFAVALAYLVFGVWSALQTSQHAGPRQRAGCVALWVVFWFFAFKEGFVRSDPTHLSFFYYGLPGALFAFAWSREQRSIAMLAMGALFVASLAAAHTSVDHRFDLVSNAEDAVHELAPVVSPSRRARLIANARTFVMANEHIAPASLQLLRHETVDAYPYLLAQVWAYRLNWRPLPVLQTYSAYTTSLDRVDAHFISSDKAPRRLIIQPAAGLDGRVSAFDVPETIREILCRYRPLRLAASNGVFALAANRCSGASFMRSVTAHWGQPVGVPPPPTKDSLVFARLHGVAPSGVERVVGLVYKPAKRYVILNRGVPRRLVAATSGDGLPLRAGTGVDFPAPYNIALGVHTIEVTKQSGIGGAGAVTYDFYSESFRPLTPPKRESRGANTDSAAAPR